MLAAHAAAGMLISGMAAGLNSDLSEALIARRVQESKWPQMQAGHNQPGARLGVCWLVAGRGREGCYSESSQFSVDKYNRQNDDEQTTTGGPDT